MSRGVVAPKAEDEGVDFLGMVPDLRVRVLRQMLNLPRRLADMVRSLSLPKRERVSGVAMMMEGEAPAKAAL